MSTDPRLEDIMTEYRFLQILGTPWKEMTAYKLGIVDSSGKILKSRKDLKEEKEKQAYPDVFFALCWNVKRLTEQVLSKKEDANAFIRSIWSLKSKYGGLSPMKYENMVENYLQEKGISLKAIKGSLLGETTAKGKYLLHGKTCVINNLPKPIGEVFGVSLYRAGKTVFTLNELKKVSEDGEGGAPANNVGGGAMAGVSPGQEPPKPKKKNKKVLKRNQIQRDAKTINIVVPSALKGK